MFALLETNTNIILLIAATRGELNQKAIETYPNKKGNAPVFPNGPVQIVKISPAIIQSLTVKIPSTKKAAEKSAA